MKVRALQLYLSSLQNALAASESPSRAAQELEQVATGLQPFAELECDQLTAFLRQADDYRRTGTLQVPPAGGVEMEQLQTSLRSVAALLAQLSAVDVDRQTVTATRDRLEADLKQSLESFLKPLAFKVTVKGDAKAFDTAVRGGRLRALAGEFREILRGATDQESLTNPERQQRLSALTGPLDVTELKAVAGELGVAKAIVRSKDALVATIVETVTGIKPAATKTARTPRTPATDPAVVQKHAIKLKGLLERSLDPDALSGAEVDAAIAELGALREADIRAIVHEAGLENVGSKKADIVKKIRLKLTESRRAQESIQV